MPSFIDTLMKAYGQRPPARGLCTRALLSEMPSPLRFGIGHPSRPKLRRYILVSAALPTKT
ncbi:hypothetical protein CJD50_09990 [Hafnia paralvei]|uniref:Uncharacterized protein n=1 Tax=Hafnia paralvei TaxID=546367 RepID=A0A2A2MDY8_9GAMM|nr:hypothetical protein CJD50_09990 [Hafnia paralvei]TBL53492.1 hypothetical protein EYZ00_10305 [Hafnia paralvei]TBL65310.1 hypothetical protein EYY97_00495 [Hafnia paralvei]